MDMSFYCQLCNKGFSYKKNYVRHNKQYHDEEGSLLKCNTCLKHFYRVDKLKEHLKNCFNADDKEYDKLECGQCSKHFSRIDSLKRHSQMCSRKEADLVKEMIEETEQYNEQYLMGKMVYEILNKDGRIKEQALSPEKKEALKIYIRDSPLNISNDVNLNMWQSQLMNYFDTPTDRHVIWIVGKNGGEGKTYFQKFILKFYGIRRVIITDLNSKSKNINYLISTQSTTCKDIFLFNINRTINDCDIAYNTLESIKDGFLTSSKYHSQTIKLKTPNIVMVFSNSFPDEKQLSHDRWIIHEIKDGQII